MAEKRTLLKGLVTEKSYRGWDKVASRENVTLTAFLEALGLEFADGTLKLPARVCEQARRIDRARRSRS